MYNSPLQTAHSSGSVSQNKHCSLLSQPDTGCRYCTLCHFVQSHTETMTVFTDSDQTDLPYFKYYEHAKISKLNCIYVQYSVPRVTFGWFRPPWNVDGLNSSVQCTTQCTINPGNGDHLSVRKIVKKQSQYSAEILQSNSVKRQTCKILSVSMCFCRASLRLGKVGTKGWFSQATVVGIATNGGTFHIYFVKSVLPSWLYSRLIHLR